ncbi:hypothetical protein FB107DRAFT_280773 [Schizophyllum commune]
MQSQADADSREQTNLAARLPPDTFQRTLNADDAHAYNISRDVPGYVGIRYIMEYVRVNRPFLWERSLDDPSLLLPLPRDAPLAPRGAPRTGSRPRLHSGPPLGGACSQQISVGINPVLGAFADALAGGKVDIFECAAQANIEFEAGKLYEFDKLFDATAYPFSKVGDCCGAHHRAVARQLRQARGQLSNLVDIRKSSSGLSRPLTRATVKSSARTRPIKRLAKGLSKELGAPIVVVGPWSVILLGRRSIVLMGRWRVISMGCWSVLVAIAPASLVIVAVAPASLVIVGIRSGW